MSLTVKLSYEEKILNALGRVKHKRTDDFITRSTREFEAIRAVLRPLYDQLAAAVTEERAACAKIVDDYDECENNCAYYIATLIRDRGAK